MGRGTKTFTESFVHEQLAQRVVFGWGRRGALGAELDRLAGARVAFVASRSARAAAAELAEGLGARVVATIDDVPPQAPRDAVERAVEAVRSARADVLVTIGGGSATGIGKGIVLQHTVPLVAVPTTYAGSEVTPIYGITDAGRKHTGRDPRALPAAVLYDPELTVSLPARTTATTGMNALAHCVEALYAPDASPVVALLAAEAILCLRVALPRCVEHPGDGHARTRALFGAYLAGTVLATTDMAIHHRICHVLGGTFGLEHGDVNAVVLPYAVAFNEPAARAALRVAADALGGPDPATALYDLARAMGAPRSLEELGLPRTALPEVARLVAARDFSNPRAVTNSGVLEVLDAAFAGARPHESTVPA